MAPGEPEPYAISRHPIIAPRPPGLSTSSPRAASVLECRENGSRRVGPQTGGGRLANRTRVACQHCRQSKLRCEGSFGGNQPCQRCTELGRPCVFDKRFKRVSKKTTLNDIADQVNILKSFGVVPANEVGLAAIPASSSQTKRRTSTNLAGAGNHQFSDRPSGNLDSDQCYEREQSLSDTASNHPELSTQIIHKPLSQRQLESIKLSPGEVKSYFEIFYVSYHPVFSILPLSASPDSIYEDSPLLFWTIIVTAARHDAADFSLLLTLLPAVKRLLWSTIPATPHTLPSLQAMAILCVWTFPVSTMPEDITYMLSGILKTAATHVGLHRPEILELYSRTRTRLGRPELLQAVRCWCSIYLAIEGASIGNGHPPVLADDYTVEKASAEPNPYDLPESLHMAIIMQLFCDKIHLALGSLTTYKTSLLSIYAPDLRELEVRMGKFQSPRAMVYFHAANFQLKSYALFDDEDSAARRDAVLEALSVAIRFIETLRQEEPVGVSIQYSLCMTRRVCLAAAIFISKVLHSSYGHLVEHGPGKAAFSTCISFFKHCSVEDNDMDGRTTTILSQLWVIHRECFETSQETPPLLSVKSRSFMSIVHDGLWQWRERYAGMPSNGAPSIPPPLISPTSMAASSSPPYAELPEPSPTRSIEQSYPANVTWQGEDGWAGISTIHGDSQQPASPPQLLMGEPESGLWAPMSEQDDALMGIEDIDQDAMQFDVLFPSFVIEPTLPV